MKLSIDERQGVRSSSQSVSVDDFAGGMAFFDRLDGGVHTLLTVIRQDEAVLMIGGGPSQFVVTLGKHGKDLTLRNPDGEVGKEIELCAGGQYSDYPAELVSSRIFSIKALKLFLPDPKMI